MLELPYSVKVLQQEPADAKHGPFFSLSQALLENVYGIRVQGMLSIVVTLGIPKLYWFENGIEDEDFVPYIFDGIYSGDLNGISNKTVSANLFYNTVQTIGYVPGNIAYQNITGGNDSTAVLGNSLRPFKTIGAAIAAIGTLQNSAIYCSAGYNYLDDMNAPFGLKSPNSYYDIYCSAGCRVDYYGTYGLYISNNTTFGSVYGSGLLLAFGSTYIGSVDGVSNYAVNISTYTTPKFIQCFDLKRETLDEYADLIRIGNCYQTAVSFSIAGRISSRGGWCITCDTSSRTYFEIVNYLASTANISGLIRVINCTQLTFNNLLQSDAYGNFLSRNQIKCISIIDNTGTSFIAFNNCELRAVDTTNPNYKLIEIVPPVSGLMPNLLFKRCSLKNKQISSYSSSGYSFYSDSNVSFKIIDTYSEKDTGGIGIITNLISSGNGLMVEPNL